MKEKNKINLIELFSGIGGFTKGFEDAGFEIENHYFSEIDKHAIANYKYNFPNAKYIGSVVDIRPNDFRNINVITFGSPCQDFSLAGKRKGLEGERSSLIQYAIELISNVRPDIFIWENVKGAFSSNGGADFWAILQAFANIGGYRLEWQLLNTKWFLPQNRERIYLVGHSATSERGFGSVFPIGENESTHFRSERSTKPKAEYSTTISTREGNRKENTFIEVKSATSQGYEIAQEGDSINLSNPNSETRRGRVGKGVAQTLDCSCNQAVIGAFRGRNPENPKSRKSGLPTEQMLEINKEGVSNTLTSVQKDNVVIQLNPSTESGGVQPYQQNRIYSENGISPALMKCKSDLMIGTWRTHKDGQGFREVSDGNCPTIPARAREDGSGQPVINQDAQIRRLTEIECEFLQGFPKNWTEYGNYDGIIKEVPKTQRYKMLGNAVTVKVVEEIAKRLLK